ncbi:hypothetical protein KR067_007185, partial [Drosophila pandora]
QALRQIRKRLELLLMLLIGLAWGIILSELLRRTRWQFSDSFLQAGGRFPSSHRTTTCPTAPPTSASTETPRNTSVPLASRLFNETRILCIVPTTPQTHKSRAIHIKRTWGLRCNKLIFMSTKADKKLGAVDLKVKEGYSNQWAKIRASLQYAYKHDFRNYDWFLKADEDTYVVMENLRSFLHPFSPMKPVYFGNKFRSSQVKQVFYKQRTIENKKFLIIIVIQGYMSGGAGYVLSKVALYRFMKFGFSNSSICSNRSYGYEDVELGRCLQAVGVVAGDSRDEHGLNRFIPFSPFQSYPEPPEWYMPYPFYKLANATTDCCSNSAITFHYSYPNDLYVLDYIIYKLMTFGIPKDLETMPAKR